MKPFRYKTHRNIKARDLLAAVRQRTEVLLDENGLGDWGDVRETERSLVISGSVGRSGIWKVIGPLGHALIRALSSFGGGGATTGYARGQVAMAEVVVRESREARAPAGHMEYLSVQVYPDSLGAEVDIRGLGSKTKRVARRLQQFLADTSDLDRKLQAKKVGSPRNTR